MILITSNLFSQIRVDVNLNVKHTIDSISIFDRSKFISIHANQTENEWDGSNFTSDLRNDFLNGYDVYLGRDTGGITWNLNNIQQDPDRAGFVDPSEIISKGANARSNFESNVALHKYEDRKSLVIAGQLNPFWTGTDQKPTSQGWYLANATATGEYMGRYINNFHGTNGQKKPLFLEIINEPAYHSLGGKNDYSNSLQEIAEFHNEVAEAIRVQAPDLKIGGYTAAFPDFEVGDFKRWENRDKLFMDVAGDNMDFFSIHLYDFPSINNGKKDLRSGSNIEATFDMMEHYSMLFFNKVKPIVVSEYGAQMHDYAQEQWSPYRDWLHIKASNSQLMSFLERPNVVASAINFIIVKAEWGYNSATGVPYNHRLMRKANEPESYTGEWVYTDMVKFYQLWKNVRGTRVDITSDNLDIQVNAYVDGNKGYIILNNLNFKEETIDLELFDSNNNSITNILKKHLTLNGNFPILIEEPITNTNSIILGAESTMILEYTFEEDIVIDETSNEIKYYANSYLKPITENTVQTFNINGVLKGNYGEAILRLGLGRAHGKSLNPVVKFNNTVIDVPSNWRGYDQADRAQFFGVLEIPVPYNLLETNNTVTVQFNDTGGHISSVSMRVFEFSNDIRKDKVSDISDDNYKIKTTSVTCRGENNGKIAIATTKTLNYFATVAGEGYNEKFSFSDTLNVNNLKSGFYTIEISIPEFPGYIASFKLQINEPEALSVVSKINAINKTVSLSLKGSDAYEITINGVKTSTTQKKIELPIQFGTNKITVTASKQCSNMFEQNVFLENGLKVYPNPSKGNLTCSTSKDMIGGELFIHSIDGVLLKTKKIEVLEEKIDVSFLPEGIYMISASKGNKVQLQTKLILSK
ncbi:T9SS type A sorting domain-containing protein [Lutibacter sp. A80]|uniref:T9SS type A sorting domain-containing protein n=1 Tax=Lutibacter sp. A80 TaxID=2918453 RepID=UPI001F060A23|nr:T9SS type A sorting domain-containing protein [Lutibacter sp. A80]UMB61759.1 T9SS type A sorting domain-containing protein [Lutibacter sp. A80]